MKHFNSHVWLHCFGRFAPVLVTIMFIVVHILLTWSAFLASRGISNQFSKVKSCHASMSYGLFVGGFVPQEDFSLTWRRHHYHWRAANLTNARDSLFLSSECFLTCHHYCDMGNPEWSSPMTRDAQTYYPAFSSVAVTTCFYDLCLSRLGLEHPNFCMQGERYHRLYHPSGPKKKEVQLKKCIKIAKSDLFCKNSTSCFYGMNSSS